MEFKLSLNEKVKIEFETPSDKSHFFGYYDKSPLDKTDRLLLCHRSDNEGREIQHGDQVEIGYYDIETGEYNVIDETKAFNFQQGSMLQWLGPDFQERVIYNQSLNGTYVSIIYNIRTKAKEITIWSIVPSLTQKLRSASHSNSIIFRFLKIIYRSCLKPLLTIKNKQLVKYSFVNFVDESDEFSLCAENLIHEDGHGTWFKNQTLFLTDTYEDKDLKRHLMIFNQLEMNLVSIGSFFSFYNSCGFRCDLHPRLNHNETKVIIDSAHNKKRQIMVLNIEGLCLQ